MVKRKLLLLLAIGLMAGAMLALWQSAGPQAATVQTKPKPPAPAAASAASMKTVEEEIRPPFEVPAEPPFGAPARPPESKDFPAPGEMARLMKEQLAGAAQDQERAKGK